MCNSASDNNWYHACHGLNLTHCNLWRRLRCSHQQYCLFKLAQKAAGHFLCHFCFSDHVKDVTCKTNKNFSDSVDKCRDSFRIAFVTQQMHMPRRRKPNLPEAMLGMGLQHGFVLQKEKKRKNTPLRIVTAASRPKGSLILCFIDASQSA